MNSFFLTLIGPFAGVLLAFAINWLFSVCGKHKRSKEIRMSLREELETCKATLYGAINLIPTQIYQAARNSGDLMVLNHKQRMLIAKIYNYCEDTNYEAKRVRDAAEDYRKDPSEHRKREWGGLSIMHQEHEKDLRKAIESLLANESLWK